MSRTGTISVNKICVHHKQGSVLVYMLLGTPPPQKGAIEFYYIGLVWFIKTNIVRQRFHNFVLGEVRTSEKVTSKLLNTFFLY